ncbi:MAG TPA: PP2C family serine/threonine-protein phosphatase [Thermomicrobiales bacterium]|nr:PP2C family serine/threonine-protein phosphatase [Thermomicrobiales bacterium]
MTHARLGIGCQDARDVAILPSGIAVAAAADGAGSAPRSADGARWAVGAATHLLWDALAAAPPAADIDAALVEAFRGAHDFIAQAAAESELPASAFATTLLLAVAAPDGLHVAQTGDGMIVARQADGELIAATTPQNGEYANETFFLTSDDGAPRFAATLPPACAVALLTDGLLPLAVDLRDCRPHAPFFDPLFAFAAVRGGHRGADAELAAFLASDRIAARTDDDTTLVLAVRDGRGSG